MPDTDSLADAHVVVFSSINEDLTLRLPHLPSRGSTTLSTHSARSLGGKGANTAVAASKAAAGSIPVSLICAVGDDPTGALLLEQLRAEHGVDVSRVAQVPRSETGRAVILVDDGGENCIVVNSGANSHLKLDNRLIFEGLRTVIGMHLEIALNVVCEAAEFVKRSQPQGFVVLNASPVPSDRTLLDRILQSVDLLILNEGEARELAKPNGGSEAEKAVTILESLAVEKGKIDIILTMGAKGALLLKRNGEVVRVNAVAVNPDQVIDTTGAGDCLTGYVCAGIAEGQDMADALRIAVAASALCVQRDGAAEAMPTRTEVHELCTKLLS